MLLERFIFNVFNRFLAWNMCESRGGATPVAFRMMVKENNINSLLINRKLLVSSVVIKGVYYIQKGQRI